METIQRHKIVKNEICNVLCTSNGVNISTVVTVRHLLVRYIYIVCRGFVQHISHSRTDCVCVCVYIYMHTHTHTHTHTHIYI
jgi:hypothetical protein